MFTKESIKQFLKPDFKKIIIFLVFSVTSVFLVYGIFRCPPKALCEAPNSYNQGFPFSVNSWRAWAYPNEQQDSWLSFQALKDGRISNTRSLFFNLIFWYFFSCFLIFAWGKIKSKKAN